MITWKTRHNKISRSRRQQKILKHRQTFPKFGEYTVHGASKCNNKKCGGCNVIMDGKSHTFKNPKTTFMINLGSNSKNVVYIIICTDCSNIYIGYTQPLNKRIFQHKSNVKLSQNRKLYVSKHLYECSKEDFKIMQYTRLMTTYYFKYKKKTS